MRAGKGKTNGATMRTIGRDGIYERGKFFLALICLFCFTLTNAAEALLNLPVSIFLLSSSDIFRSSLATKPR